MMCLNIGTPNNQHFPFGINVKVVVLGVTILKHFRVEFDISLDIAIVCVFRLLVVLRRSMEQ